MMFRALLKKQLLELSNNMFRSRRRGKAGGAKAGSAVITVLMLVLLVMLGGMFFFLARWLSPLITAGLGWLYYLIITAAAMFFGIFGSVFNTFSSLYQAKDNDLLLSMPVPVRMIMTVRLAGVYIMGLIYCSIAMIPGVVVYCMTASAGFGQIVGGLIFILVLSVLILTLSCALGWVVSKISLKLKNKSIITVLVALVFIALYYVVYFNAGRLIGKAIADGSALASRIRGAAYPIYAIGRAAEGSVLPLICFAGIVAVLFALTCLLISRGFIKTVTSSGAQKKKVYKEKTQKIKSPSGALLYKEFKRFTSSSTYMLNSALGSAMLIAASVFALIKGASFADLVDSQFGAGNSSVLGCALVCFLVSVNIITAPSISLEGKSLWIVRSLPVSVPRILDAKIRVHMLVTGIPSVICSLCVCAAIRPGAAEAVLIVIIPLVLAFFCALFGLLINLKKPVLDWASEAVAVKQSLSVFLAMTFCMLIPIAYTVLWFLLGAGRLSPALYMAVWTVLIAALAGALYAVLRKNGGKMFESI